MTNKKKKGFDKVEEKFHEACRLQKEGNRLADDFLLQQEVDNIQIALDNIKEIIGIHNQRLITSAGLRKNDGRF